MDAGDTSTTEKTTTHLVGMALFATGDESTAKKDNYTLSANGFVYNETKAPHKKKHV